MYMFHGTVILYITLQPCVLSVGGAGGGMEGVDGGVETEGTLV